MALRKFLILRKLRSSCLEGCTALIQRIVNFLAASVGMAEIATVQFTLLAAVC